MDDRRLRRDERGGPNEMRAAGGVRIDGPPLAYRRGGVRSNARSTGAARSRTTMSSAWPTGKKAKMLVTKGAAENRHRPGIDPLFRSAAVSYGSRVVKRCGGVTVTQDPRDAAYSGMPLSARERQRQFLGTSSIPRGRRLLISTMAELKSCPYFRGMKILFDADV
jgi:hypothetical protein